MNDNNDNRGSCFSWYDLCRKKKTDGQRETDTEFWSRIIGLVEPKIAAEDAVKWALFGAEKVDRLFDGKEQPSGWLLLNKEPIETLYHNYWDGEMPKAKTVTWEGFA